MKLELVSSDRYFVRAKFKLLVDLDVEGIIIPEGAITDGISVPRFVVVIGLLLFAYGCFTTSVTWMLLGAFLNFQTIILPTFGSYHRAVLVHDHLFAQGDYTLANYHLGRILRKDGVSFFKRKYIMLLVNIYKYFK